MGETSVVRGDRTVLVFAEEERGEEVAQLLAAAVEARTRAVEASLSLSLSLSLSFSLSPAPSILILRTTQQVLRELRARVAWSLVIDPEYSIRVDADLVTFCERIRILVTPLSRVLLFSDPTVSALRGTCAIANSVECSLFVRGLDNQNLARELLRPSSMGRAVEHLVAELAPGLASLTPELRKRWVRMLSAPSRDSIKRIAADVGMTSRSMERWFASSGLPGPGDVLRRITAAHARDASILAGSPQRGSTIVLPSKREGNSR